MTKHAENQLLFRRFLIVALAITLGGILLANLLVSTRDHSVDYRVHDRLMEWKQMESTAKCDELHCAWINGIQEIV